MLRNTSTPGVSPINTPNKKTTAAASGKPDADESDAAPRHQENGSAHVQLEITDIPDASQVDSMVVEPGSELPSQNVTEAPSVSRLGDSNRDFTANSSWHPTQR